MTTDDKDLTWQTLLEAREELAPDMDLSLLRTCYGIQKRYQFSSEPSIPLALMEDAINEHVDMCVQGSSGKGAR